MDMLLFNIEYGCAKGQKCNIGCYILPFAGSKEAFTKYINTQEDLINEHSKVDTYIEVG